MDDQLAVAVFNCNPIDAYWDTQISNKACVTTLHYFLSTQIPNIIMDVAILILPLPYLWKINVTLLSQKAGLLLVFTFGILCVSRISVTISRANERLSASSSQLLSV